MTLGAAPRRALAPTSVPGPYASPLRALRFASASLRHIVKSDAQLMSSVKELEKNVVATITARTVSGKIVQEYRGQLTRENYGEFRLDSVRAQKACDKLKSLGFEILRVGRFAITGRGPAALFRDALKVELQVSALPRRITAPSEPRAMAWDLRPPSPRQLFVTPPTGITVSAKRLSEDVDSFVFIPPHAYFQAAPSAKPPKPRYWHLEEDDIRSVLKVDQVMQTGKGVRLCLIDSGFFVRHPYYALKAFQPRLVSAEGSDPAKDSNGHGTGITLNALAVAPRAEFVLVNDSPSAQAAFDAALAEKPQIISCSWGWPYEQSFPTLEATIRSAVLDDGITVLFAAGNGDMAWPGSMPEVISVGGVYADEHTELQASSYASGYMSSLYPNRRVPDLSGLVGAHPRGIYIVLPTQPGSEMDRGFGGKSFPYADETRKTDGWVVASGTSSATPQLAGIAALLLEKNSSLTPEAVKNILTTTATPVQKGNNALGFPAHGHPNVAVGFGLANGHAALKAA